MRTNRTYRTQRERARERRRGRARLSVPPPWLAKEASIRELQLDDEERTLSPREQLVEEASLLADDWRVGLGGSKAPSQ